MTSELPRPEHGRASGRARAAPSFRDRRPASSRARRAAQGSSRKSSTRCELVLRRILWRQGLRYRRNFSKLPGKPDIVFPRERVAVFCDGDFWHGRDLEDRVKRLARGHNAPYWVAKIEANVARDRNRTARLLLAGWRVLRLWESDILRDPDAAAAAVAELWREARAESIEEDPRRAAGAGNELGGDGSTG